MLQSKFSLADVLTLLTALAFSFVCFLGANFSTLGDTEASLVIGYIIALFLWGTAFGAKLLKRATRNFRTCFIFEIILVVLFSGSTLILSIGAFPHYFVVSKQRTEIQSNLIASINQAENMFAAYERYAEDRISLYGDKLRSVVAAKNTNPGEFAAYGFENNSIPNDKQIENKMFVIRADLFLTNYEEMKQVSTTWLADARNIVERWKPIGIVRVVNVVEQNSNDWLNTLVELSEIREKGEQTSDFEYHLSFEDVKERFTTTGNPTWATIGMTVAAYFMMLLSWIISKRSSKTKIGKTKTKGEFDVDY